MKGIKYLLYTFILFVFVGTVYAAPAFSIQPNKFSIQDGQSVTLTIRVSNTAAWSIKVVSSGNTNGCSNSWADATDDGENTTKTFTTTCKASSAGSIVFVVTGDITDSSGSTREINDTTKITVTEYVAPTKSSINTLNSLEVQGYELTPEFDPNVTEYSTTVPYGTESVYINITKKDSKSVANGDFKDVKLSEGANKCVITVTAEDGGKKTYVVMVNVESEDPIVVSVGDTEYTVVTNPKLIETPSGFEVSTVTINEKEVPAFVNEKSKITLVGLKDSEGNIKLFIYDNGNYKPYEVIVVDGLTFIVMEPEETLTKFNRTKIIKINDKEYKVYYADDEETVLVYGMNVNTGNIGWYRYDTVENTFLRYKADTGNTVKEKVGKNYLPITILFGVLLLIAIVIILILNSMNNKKDKNNKKLIAILESKMHKANGEHLMSANINPEDANTLDLRFLELIDKEGEASRNGEPEETKAVPVVEESVEELDVGEESTPEEVEEEPKELSKKELKRLAKQLKKEEEREAKEMRDEFLATRENEILSDDDILEEIPNSEKVLNPKKNKKLKKKKR